MFFFKKTKVLSWGREKKKKKFPVGKDSKLVMIFPPPISEKGDIYIGRINRF